ncbi:YhfC family glutamic-type intramembrane protease [Chloroflexota bacterium]
MIVLRTVNAVLMILFPIAAAAFFINRYKSYWRLWIIGGSLFVISQLGHIPFNYFAGKILNNTNLVLWDRNQQILFNAVFLGLSAGVWEETSRYLGYKIWMKKPKLWREGFILGLGHGSFEAIILGFLSLYVLLQMVAFKETDLSLLVPLDQVDLTFRTIQAYWNVDWYDSFLGIMERLLTIPIHVLISILIIQVFKRSKLIWLFGAILFHALIDASVVLLISYSTIYITEGLLALFALTSIILIINLKDGVPISENGHASPKFMSNKTDRTIELDDSLLDVDDSRFL